MTLWMSTQLHETATGKTTVRWDPETGFSIATMGLNSSGRSTLPIDPASIDKLVEEWPAFREKARIAADAKNAPPVTPSRSDYRDGRDARSSGYSPRAPNPPSTTSGSGGRNSASERASDVALPPAGAKDLFS